MRARPRRSAHRLSSPQNGHARVVERFALTAPDLLAVADQPELYWALRPPLLAVIVVPQLEGYAHARLWQVFAETQAVDSTVGRTRAEGLRWLEARDAGDAELGVGGAG